MTAQYCLCAKCGTRITERPVSDNRRIGADHCPGIFCSPTCLDEAIAQKRRRQLWDGLAIIAIGIAASFVAAIILQSIANAIA